MNIGILGSGMVAQTLAAGFVKHGYSVMLGTRDSAKLAEFQTQHPEAKIGSVPETARFGSILVLAVMGRAAEAVLEAAGSEALAGKTVIDTTNPIDDESAMPPTDGVLDYFTGMNESLLERLQHANPSARLVKAFNSVGNTLMVDPDLPGGPPTMFIAGDHDEAKAETTQILETFGWAPEDMGTARAARAIEPLCMLWCILGFRENRWSHAFKLLEQH